MAIGFRLIANVKDVEYRVVRIASQAYTIGDSVQQDRTADAIDVTPATATTLTTDIFGVAMETVASTATQLLIAMVDAGQRWTADSVNAPTTNDNYERMILTDKATVNNTHTDSTTSAAVVTQVGVADVTNKRIVVQFNRIEGISN